MMLHSYKDLGSVFYIPVFTIGGGLSSGLCHVTFVVFGGSSHLTCFGCVFWLEQSLVSMVRNKNKSHGKANTATPDFWSACFEMLPRTYPLPCRYWNPFKGCPYTWVSLLARGGERLIKTKSSSQGQWCCLIQLETLRSAHLNKTFWDWYFPVVGTVPKTVKQWTAFLTSTHYVLGIPLSYLWWHKMSFITAAVY